MDKIMGIFLGILPVVLPLTGCLILLEIVVPAVVKGWNRKAHTRQVNQCLKSYKKY